MSEKEFHLSDYVDGHAVGSAAEYAQAFQNGQPFRHVVIDQFLTPDFCRQICEQFPGFETEHAVSENKKVGGKATRQQMTSLGQPFIKADELVQNPGFLALIEQITGIEQLQYDPFYYGGGTHENREGQELDPHIDFNLHPVSNQHRRLNLIIYLNEEWDDAWGGSLQLHRDPYLEPVKDEIVTVTPLMNRCVIFETNEHSWHGFEHIVLPGDKKQLSRKSFAVYYYTDTRPVEDTAGEHSTVYVDRHLPERFKPAMSLGSDDIDDIKRLLVRRDHHLKRLYKDIQGLRAKLNQHRYPGGGRAVISLEFDQAPEDLQSAVQMIGTLRRKVEELESSTSWRITAPIRALKRLLTGTS